MISENWLRQALRDFRYTSSVTGRQRGLMEHHVEALAPYLLRELREAGADDTARLDWLHERMTGDYGGGLAHCWRDIGIENGAVILRDAIDRAMKAER